MNKIKTWVLLKNGVKLKPPTIFFKYHIAKSTLTKLNARGNNYSLKLEYLK